MLHLFHADLHFLHHTDDEGIRVTEVVKEDKAHGISVERNRVHTICLLVFLDSIEEVVYVVKFSVHISV